MSALDYLCRHALILPRNFCLEFGPAFSHSHSCFTTAPQAQSSCMPLLRCPLPLEVSMGFCDRLSKRETGTHRLVRGHWFLIPNKSIAYVPLIGCLPHLPGSPLTIGWFKRKPGKELEQRTSFGPGICRIRTKASKSLANTKFASQTGHFWRCMLVCVARKPFIQTAVPSEDLNTPTTSHIRPNLVIVGDLNLGYRPAFIWPLTESIFARGVGWAKHQELKLDNNCSLKHWIRRNCHYAYFSFVDKVFFSWSNSYLQAY